MVSIRSFSSEVYDIKKTIELMSLLPDDYTLDIYGEGKLILKYKKLIVKMNLEKRVKIIPKFLDHENMKKTFRSYDLFISTTRFDSQGVTMLEAVSSGLLLVTINNSSREEFIEDGVTGLLANNIDELSNKILEITNNNALFQKVVLQGSSKMKDLSTNCISEKEIDALKNVIL
jgi:glycosyltransferase involved in cell wall biosynthesis